MFGLPSIDAIKQLTQDHRAVERLFKAYERAGDRASKEKQRLVDQVIRELSIHASKILDSGKDLVRGTARSARGL